MSDIRSFSKNFIIEFIELYKSMPCLWKLKSSDYTNKDLKNAAYERLARKLREVIPDAGKDTVLKKIDSLRGSFRREYKKWQKSIKSGAGPDDIYKPKLWYFENLLFLKDQKIAKTSIQHDEAAFPREKELDQSLDDSISQQNFKSEFSMSSCLSPSVSPPPPPPPPRRKRKHKKSRLCEEVLVKISKKLDVANTDDEYDTIGKNIAIKLRRLPNDVKIVAEKFILDVLFNAEIGCINKYTTLTLNNPTVREGFLQNINNNLGTLNNTSM